MMAHHMNSLSVSKVLRDLYRLPGTPGLKTEEDGGGEGGLFGRDSEEKLEKIIPTLTSQTGTGTFPTLSERVCPFSRPARQWERGEEEFSIQIFALLGSREIRDKTLHKIFMVLIPFSLKRMTIETCTYE